MISFYRPRHSSHPLGHCSDHIASPAKLPLGHLSRHGSNEIVTVYIIKQMQWKYCFIHAFIHVISYYSKSLGISSSSSLSICLRRCLRAGGGTSPFFLVFLLALDVFWDFWDFAVACAASRPRFWRPCCGASFPLRDVCRAFGISVSRKLAQPHQRSKSESIMHTAHTDRSGFVRINFLIRVDIII